MTKIISILILLVLILRCKVQKNNENTNGMKTFDIKKSKNFIYPKTMTHGKWLLRN